MTDAPTAPAPSLSAPPPVLVADIGGTNARFGLMGETGVDHSAILACADFPTLEAAARTYLERARPARPLRQGALAIAGPVTGDHVVMTNHVWSFSIRATRGALGLERLEVINDFTAVALAVPRLGAADRVQIGGGTPESGRVIGVIGPGSGLGVSGLVPGPGGWVALSGEGGHVTMPAATERESAVLDRLRRQFEHVSAERVISGPGLVNLHEALCALSGRDPQALSPAAITAAALSDGDPLCVEAVALFCAMLGTVAGNLALTLGARGGIYIAGGIVPQLGDFLARSAFRERFVGKGRLRSYLDPIPTCVITHALPAFLGLRAVLDQPLPS